MLLSSAKGMPAVGMTVGEWHSCRHAPGLLRMAERISVADRENRALTCFGGNIQEIEILKLAERVGVFEPDKADVWKSSHFPLNHSKPT